MLTKDLIAKIRHIEIHTRKIVDELTAGAYHSVFKGRGMEFSEVREYMAGDDVRAIDWNVTARFGHPFIKKFIEERELTVLLAVDVSGSGDFGSTAISKNEQAAELAALLAFSVIRNNDQIGLLLFSSRPELYVPPRKGRRHVLRLVRELLAHKRENRQTDIAAGIQHLMSLTPRKAIVFLISDMLDSNYEKMLSIAAKKHDLVVMRLLDKRELELPKTGFLTVEDAENDVQTIVAGKSPRFLKNYRQTAAGEREKQDQWFKRNGIDLIDIFCGDDYVKPLMQFFNARKKRR